jgi:hypothetical protein
MWWNGADVVTLSNDFAGRKRKSYFLVTRGTAIAGTGGCGGDRKSGGKPHSSEVGVSNPRENYKHVLSG